MSGKISMRNKAAKMDVLDDAAIGWDTDAAWDLVMDDADDESIFADFDDLEPIPLTDNVYQSFGGDHLVGDDESSVTSTTTCYQPAVATLPLPSQPAYRRHTAVSLCSGRSSSSSSGSNRSHASGSSSVTSTSLEENQVDGNLTSLKKKLADSMKRSTETRVALQQSMTTKTKTNNRHTGTTMCRPHDDNAMDYRMRQFQTSMMLVAQSNKVVAQQGSSERHQRQHASHAPPRAGNKNFKMGSPLSCTTAAKTTVATAIVSPTSVTYASTPQSPSSPPYHGHYRNRPRRRSSASSSKTKPWNSSKHTRRALLQMKQALRAAKHATHLTCCIDSPRTTPKAVTPKVLVPTSSWTMSPMNQSPLSTTRNSSMTAFLKQNYPTLYASSQKSQQSRPTATPAVAGAAASSSSTTTAWTHGIDTNAKRRCSLL